MGILMSELLGKNSIADVLLKHQQNLAALLTALQVLRAEYGKPMHVTSGYRSMQQHLDIYRAKAGVQAKPPLGSAHLEGLAVDFADSDGDLYTWLRTNQHGICVMEDLGLYGELGTQAWVHLQLRKPGSGNRWFKAF